MNRYRVKTEVEFIKEFGFNWRGGILGKSFPPEMDYLLGARVPGVFASKFPPVWNISGNRPGEYWCLTPKMVTSLSERFEKHKARLLEVSY